MARDFFGPAHKARSNATIDYVEQFMVDDFLHSSAIHAPSQTIIGGPRGGVWLVRAHVLLLANIAACTHRITPPVPPPETYQTDRLTDAHWSRAISWTEYLLERYAKSNQILSDNLPQRVRPPPPEQGCGPTLHDVTSIHDEGSDTDTLQEDIPSQDLIRIQPGRSAKQSRAEMSKRPESSDSERSNPSDDWSDSDEFVPRREDSSDKDNEDSEQARLASKGKAVVRRRLPIRPPPQATLPASPLSVISGHKTFRRFKFHVGYQCTLTNLLC
jgi:hypothetical protein